MARPLAEQLKKLSELRGPVLQALRDRLSAQNRAQRDILAALKAGPRTVPELSAAVNLDARLTLWYVTGLRKYGKIEDVPGRGVYPKYALKGGEAG